MGKVLTGEEFKKELQKLNEIEKNRIIVEFDKNANVDDILATLKSVDEIKIQLDEETVLRLHHNNRYMINDELYGFNASDTEAGFTEEKGRRVSNNFTGSQLYRKYIKFLLNIDKEDK